MKLAESVLSVPVVCPMCGEEITARARLVLGPTLARVVTFTLRPELSTVEQHLADCHGRPGPDSDGAPYALPAAA